jgi:hypothetical protein
VYTRASTLLSWVALWALGFVCVSGCGSGSSLTKNWGTNTPPPTPMETDNTTATGYSNGTITQKHTKTMDMCFYWIKDRVKQCQFYVYWGPGFQNLADYFTKHHWPAHHKRMREIYIHADKQPINQKGIRDSALRGCVNTSGKAGAQIPPPREMIHLPVGDNAVCR